MSTTLFMFLLGFWSRLLASQTTSAEHLFTEQMTSRKSFNPAKRSITPSAVFGDTGPKFAIETLGSLLIERLLNIGKDNPECVIAIYNDQVLRRLINPLVFIKHGANSLPPLLDIKPKSLETTTFEAVLKPMISDTSGILSYEISDTAVRLFIFWKVERGNSNKFMVQLLDKYDESPAGFSTLYESMKASEEIIKIKGAMGHYTFDTMAQPLGPLKSILYIRAQMNMLPEAQLSVRISDSNPAQALKRASVAATAIISLSALTVNMIFKKIKSYIPTDQSCTILMENISKDFTLVEPVWYVTAGQVVNLIPWVIKSGEIGEASITVPFGGAKLKETFSHTIFFVCYQIDKTGLAVVVATWFPLKLQPGKNNRYSVFLMYFSKSATPVSMQAGNVITILGDTLLKFYDNPERFEAELAKLNPGIDPFLVANAPQNRFPMVVADSYQTYHEWNFPHTSAASQIFGSGVKSVKVVASIGNGLKAGLYLKIDVEKGQGPGFPLPNPQVYKEKSTKGLVEQELVA